MVTLRAPPLPSRHSPSICLLSCRPGSHSLRSALSHLFPLLLSSVPTPGDSFINPRLNICFGRVAPWLIYIFFFLSLHHTHNVARAVDPAATVSLRLFTIHKRANDGGATSDFWQREFCFFKSRLQGRCGRQPRRYVIQRPKRERASLI